MLSLIHTVAFWLDKVGYLAIFVVLMAESLGIPSPSEIVLLFAGYIVWQGHFFYPEAVMAGALGSTVGAVGAYCIAFYGGRPLLVGRLKFLFKNEERLAYWDNYFLTRGDRVIVIARIISGVRMLISYPAGLFHMPFGRFLLYTFIGSVLWPLLAITVGYLLGPHVESGIQALHRYEIPAIVVIAAGLAALWFIRRRKQKREEARENA